MAFLSIENGKLFDTLLEKATSPLLLEPDWESILQICDILKTQEISAQYTIESIKKKFSHTNARVVLGSLQCLESVVKNCGGLYHREVAQKDTIDALKELAKTGSDPVHDKVLELIQCWSHVLGEQYKIYTDTYNLMKLEDYRFPPIKENEAMFATEDIAPEWRDDKECFRCRQIFTTFIRKHHCRACGDIFCHKCSSKSHPVLKYGMDNDVRVCDSCYEKLTSGVPLSSSNISKTVPETTTATKQTKTQDELDEEESFQLALAISKSEADEKERQKKMLTQKYAQSTFVPASDNEHTELNINQGHQSIQIPNQTDNFLSDKEIDQFTTLVTDHLNNFKFRMLSNQQRYRNITIDTAVQSVFIMLQQLHPELHHYTQLLDNKQVYYENLQDKLNQLKDAREALNALRSEHYERKQKDALERERQRQIQLAQKLDMMRQKKQEYLQYQRQVHLQHLAQQELEMQTRLEQQRQLTSAREQFAQNAHLSMTSYDYTQLSHHQPYGTLPPHQSIDPAQTSHYARMMGYSPNTDIHLLPTQPISYPPYTHGNNNYINAAGQIPLTNSTTSYTQQQTPVMNREKSEPQLILFD